MNGDDQQSDPTFGNVLVYLHWHSRMEALDSRALANELLNVAPVIGALGELCDLVAERLAPGIIEDRAKREEDLRKGIGG